MSGRDCFSVFLLADTSATMPGRDIPPKRKPRGHAELPFAQVNSMFRERMQSFMLQDVKEARNLWRSFGDTANTGVITAEQFHKVLLSMGLRLSSEHSAKFMSKFTDGRNDRRISFPEFFHGILGLPLDFFSMNLARTSTAASPKHDMDVQLGKKLPPHTNPDAVFKLFKARARAKLLDIDHVLSRILRKTKSSSHFEAGHLFNVLHGLGITLNAREIDGFMALYDHDRDGRLHFREFAHDLLEIIKPSQTRHIARQPPLPYEACGSKRLRDVIYCLRLNCERVAAPPVTIASFFKRYDTDGSGRVSYDELKAMVRDLNCQVDGIDVAAMLLQSLSPHTGVLTYMQFMTEVLGLREDSLRDLGNPEVPSTPEILNEVASRTKQRIFSTPIGMQRAFTLLSEDPGAGDTIRLAEFRHGVKTLGLPLNRKQTDQLFAKMDPAGLGRIDREALAREVQCDLMEGEAAQPKIPVAARQPSPDRSYDPKKDYFKAIMSRERIRGGGLTTRSTESTLEEVLANFEDCGLPSGRRAAQLIPSRPKAFIQPPPATAGSSLAMSSPPRRLSPVMKSKTRAGTSLSRNTIPNPHTAMHTEFMNRCQSAATNPMVPKPAGQQGGKRVRGGTLAASKSARLASSHRNNFNAAHECHTPSTCR